MRRSRGYTLIELMVAVGLFALIMTLATGAYLIMISVNRQAQGIGVGIDNLSYAVDIMARNIRTGSGYNCAGLGDCPAGGTSFSFVDSSGSSVSYSIASSTVMVTKGGATYSLMAPRVVVSSLMFYVTGTTRAINGEYTQPHVTIVLSGTVTYGPGKSAPFTVETGATMRGSDL